MYCVVSAQHSELFATNCCDPHCVIQQVGLVGQSSCRTDQGRWQIGYPPPNLGLISITCGSPLHVSRKSTSIAPVGPKRSPIRNIVWRKGSAETVVATSVSPPRICSFRRASTPSKREFPSTEKT